MTNRLIQAGQNLLAKGLAIVPCHHKQPVVKDWPNTKLDADELAGWCHSDYVTGLAVVSGQLSDNVCVLDFDGPDWQPAFEHFTYTLDLSASPTVQTGSGRRHVYVRCPDLPELATVDKFSRNGASVELRGNRCVNVCPPSQHPSGDFYRWLDQDSDMQQFKYHDLTDVLSAWGKVHKARPKETAGLVVQTTYDQFTADYQDVIPAGAMRQRFRPEIQHLHQARSYGRLPRSALEFLAIAGQQPAGDRNSRLYRASQQFCAAGYSLTEGLDILVLPALRSGLEPDEVQTTIHSAYKGAANFTPLA